MTDVLLVIISSLGTTFFVVGLVVILIVGNPEKVEKWASIINKILAGFGGIFKSAHRNYVKYDLQSRINTFTKEVKESAPYFEDSQIKIVWADPNTDREQFIENGVAILRLRRDDPEDLNFVHGAYWTVSTKLLPRVKRYISPSQRKAVDLYVTGRVIDKEKLKVKEYFLEHYLHKDIDKNAKIRDLYLQFQSIDRYGAFYPVLLQELYFLSLKVYGELQNEEIIKEVTRLADFLHGFATRAVGEEIENEFTGEYSKFAIVIVGTGEKMALEGEDPYIKYVQKRLLPKKIETIYILGKYQHYDFINDVCDQLYMNYDVYKKHDYQAQLTFDDGGTMNQHTYLIVLRYLDAEMYGGRSIHEDIKR